MRTLHLPLIEIFKGYFFKNLLTTPQNDGILLDVVPPLR